MPNDQPLAAESSVEDRLTAFFGGGQQKVTPTVAETPPVADAETETSEAEEQPQLEASETDDEQSEQQPEVPTEEIDWEGEKYVIPAKLKPALMMQADYTRKTQSLAEVQRSIEAEKFALNSERVFNQQVQPLFAQQQQLRSMQEQAKKLDWTQLTTDQKIDLDRELRNIDKQIAEIDQQIGSKRQEHESNINRAVMGAIQSTEAYMAQKVPSWTQASGNSLHEYGLSLGIPKQALISGWFSNPVNTHLMWKAQQWDALQAGKPAVANKAAKALPVVKASSAQANQSTQQSRYKQARDNLRKTGSLDAFAQAFLASSRKR